jgi:hypothetical protein
VVAYSAVQEFERVRAGKVNNAVLCAAAADMHTIFNFRTVGGIEEIAVLVVLAKVGAEGKLGMLGGCHILREGLARLSGLKRHDGSGQGLECWSHCYSCNQR